MFFRSEVQVHPKYTKYKKENTNLIPQNKNGPYMWTYAQVNTFV